MNLRTPWIIHEAEVALYPAWKDGMPFRGPGSPRGVPAPVFQALASLTIAETRTPAAESGYNWTGAEPKLAAEWEITASFPDGAFDDPVSRVMSRLAAGGFHILCCRYLDEHSGNWSCFRWYYVTLETDDSAESGEEVLRSLKFKATWMQESAGTTALPSLSPSPLGEVSWICGSQRIVCLTYDPDSETWTSLDRNETGEDVRYVNLAPVEDSDTEIALSGYFPRVVDGTQPAPALQRGQVEWRNLVLATLGNHLSELHHGLVLHGGLRLQTMGIVEPLMAVSQDRMLDEPVIVFHYLRRVYATIGHGVLALPALAENLDPPFTHDYAFRLCVPGDPNPATGQSGLVLLPDGAYLDGTVAEIR